MPKSKFVNRIRIAGLVACILVMVAACTNSEETRKGGETAREEQTAVQTGFNRLSDSQPVPVFDWSQERQTLIDVETIRALGANSTTAGYLEGVGLIWWCPSIGMPVASTHQLSGSTQWVDIPGDDSRELFAIDQGEPTGVYVGESTGTYTVCLMDDGTKFLKYWEGYTDSTSGVVTTYESSKRVMITGTNFTVTERPG